MYEVIIDKEAKRSLAKLPKNEQARIIKKIEALASDPRPEGIVALQGKHSYYRQRNGNYRVIYSVKDEILTVFVVKIDHRRQVYKD